MSNPSATPSLTPPTPTPRSEKLDPMDQHAERQLAAAGNYPQSGSPGRRRGELDGQADNGGRMEVDQSNAHRQSLSLLPSSNHPRSTEVSPTTTTGNFHSHVAIDPSLTTTGDNAGLGGGGEQREPLTGPTRTHSKPAPLNLRSISNSSTLQAPGSCIGPGNEAASPYAGHYAQRLERRASQYPVSAGAGYNQASMSATSSPQPPPAQQQAASITTDESMRYPGSDRPPARPAPLAHSASLPVLPSQDPMTSSSPATYPSHPHQGAPGSTTGQGQGQNYSRAYSYGYGQGAGESSNAQQPPPFPHAYSSPAVPMYPPGSHSHHYPGYTHMPPGYPPPMQHHHASSYQPYPPQQHYRGPGAPGTLASPSFVGSGATGGYPAPHPSSNSTGNTPGVLVIGANGQIMPHNAAQMVGGRGTPLSERPFKCDECVQSFNRNHDLKRHKRIHLAVKPFACEKCGKQFSRKDALRRHWLVKGCKASDDPNVNMANPAYQGSKTSSASPSNSTPPSLPQHHHMHQPPPQHAYANHPTMLRTPSYGGGPMVVTPDDEAFGAYNNGYSMHPQFRQPMPPTNMSANTSPASTRPPGGSIGYGAPPARPLDRVPTPGSATFPGQLDPAITANTMSEPVSSTTNTKLPGRYSLDARLHTTSSPSLERNDLGTRSASVSMPLTDGNHHKRTHGPPVMVLQADGMIEQTVQLPGQPNATIKRMSRDGYFEGAFNGGHENGSGGMDQALDSYVSVPASTAPKSASASSPSFAMPFDKSSRESLEASTNNGPGSDAWNSTPRWHRPSFPFPPAGSSVYRAPDSMEDSTDLRKSISHRASVSQQHHHQQQQQANFANGSGSSIRPAQRWTRASFPFPEKPDNGMGIRSGDTNQQ